MVQELSSSRKLVLVVLSILGGYILLAGDFRPSTDILTIPTTKNTDAIPNNTKNAYSSRLRQSSGSSPGKQTKGHGEMLTSIRQLIATKSNQLIVTFQEWTMKTATMKSMGRTDHHGADPSWCWDKTRATKSTPAGLMYVKLHKAASSTLAGVTLHIAHRHGKREATESPFLQNLTTTTTKVIPCLTRHEHSLTRYPNRDRSKSFVFSSIRYPSKRTMSYLQYIASNRQRDENWIWNQLQSNQTYPRWTSSKVQYENGYQLGYLTTESPPPKGHPLLYPRDQLQILNRVQRVLQDYDLIMITERLDESLVVLGLLLNISMSDLLYVKGSKQTGGYSSVNHKCHRLQPISQHVQDLLAKHHYFEEGSIGTAVSYPSPSPSPWMEHNWGDYLLYHAVNASLDATIRHLNTGQDGGTTTATGRFDVALQEYRTMMQQAHQLCFNTTIFPCSGTGQYLGDGDCYSKDWGCGYQCLNEHFPPSSSSF